MSTRSEIAIHRSAVHSPSISSTRQSPRCRTLLPRSSSRRKSVALPVPLCALPSDAALFFADAALAAQSGAVASFPPVASFETAVYAVSCYLDTMVQQSLAGKKKKKKTEEKDEEAQFRNWRELADDAHPEKKKKKKKKKLETQTSQARPRPPLRSSAPRASRPPCRPARSPCSP